MVTGFNTAVRLTNPLRPEDEKKMPCQHCGAGVTGRNLIISFDGTSNQFGNNNTNVIELYDRIIKDDTQLTYYNSGIGTYARRTFASVSYWKKVLNHKIDLAIAWNFEDVLLAGYRWLSDNYQPGDKIFLFGFSRGAYQVRALAGMIKKVGLILRGNEEQIPFAYELYADLKGSHKDEVTDMAERFKKTFSRQNVKVHFLGAWDTVSSVGVIRGKSLPVTDDINDNICYFRHALALDERRVKFLPEYVCGGQSYEPTTKTPTPTSEPSTQESIGAQHEDNTAVSEDINIECPKTDGVEQSTPSPPRVKEVWFAGCHSDIGGGCNSNVELNNAAVPVLWMGKEALLAGLKLRPSELEWKWDELRDSTPTESLSPAWRLFEILPFKRLSYIGRRDHTWRPHFARGRLIKPGQKIHASVAFIHGYTPRAMLPMNWRVNAWKAIVGKGEQHNVKWAEGLQDVLEMDLFDFAEQAEMIIQQVLDDQHNNSFYIGRLGVMASTHEGAQAIITADPNLKLLYKMLSSDDEIKAVGAAILTNVVTRAFNADLPRSLDQLAAHLSAINCRSEALDTTKHAVWVLEKLATQNPEAFRSNLASSLNNLSICLFEVGRREEALDEIRKAVEIQKKLAAEQPAVFNSNLVVFLDNFSRRLSDLSRRDEALEKMQQAMEIQRMLAREDPAKFYPDLARIHNNFSNCLSDVGYLDEAVEHMQQAVEIYDKLARCPVELMPEFARYLYNFSIRLFNIDRRDEALKSIQKAIDIWQKLAMKDLAAFNPDLAQSLHNYSLYLLDMGRREEALNMLERVIGIYRKLAMEYPGSFDQPLARALYNLSFCLSDMDRRDEALEATRQAVEIWRQLAAGPAASEPDFAQFLNGLSLSLSEVGRRDEALEAVQQAVEIQRELVAERPATFHPDLAQSLHNFSICLSDMGRQEDAMVAAQEAVMILRGLAAEHPAAFNPNLARSFSILSLRNSNMGFQCDAHDAIYRALEIQQKLVAKHPAAFEPDLAESLHNRSLCMANEGHQSWALELIEQAVEIQRNLAAARPASFNPDLARFLNALCLRQFDTGCHDKALKTIQEAVEMRRKLVSERPTVFNSGLAQSLHNLSFYLSSMGRKNEALEAIEEAVGIRKKLVAECSVSFNPDLALSLHHFSLCLSSMGYRDEAAEVMQQAVEIQ